MVKQKNNSKWQEFVRIKEKKNILIQKATSVCVCFKLLWLYLSQFDCVIQEYINLNHQTYQSSLVTIYIFWISIVLDSGCIAARYSL